ncbi:MAG: diaminopimelate decarboxylase [Planctomycetota bacterium]
MSTLAMVESPAAADFHRRHSVSDAQRMLRRLLDESILAPERPAVIVHDLFRLHDKLRALRDAFPEMTRHAIAIKANPLVEVLKEIVKVGFGLEAASVEETELARAAGCPHDRIVFDSPAKTDLEIQHALRCGFTINVDNATELKRIARLYKPLNSQSLIGLRINPEVGPGTIGTTSVAARGSKFGFSLSTQADDLVQAFASHAFIRGLHVHTGSQGCGIELLTESIRRVTALARRIETETHRPVEIINIGGGLAAKYDDDDHAATPLEYADRLRDQVPDLFHDRRILATEMGRAIHAGCGIAFSRVEYVRPADGEIPAMATLHLGADFLLRPVYRPDDWKHEFFVFDARGTPRPQSRDGAVPTTLAGPLCFGGDLIAKSRVLPPIQEGDYVAIRDCGAYTLAMWSRHCSRGIPRVLGWCGPDAPMRLLRREETPQDIASYWASER